MASMLILFIQDYSLDVIIHATYIIFYDLSYIIKKIILSNLI